MKKLSVFALAALMLVALTAPAGAVEHSLKGNWWTKAQLMEAQELVAGVGVDDLQVGMPMELVLETLHEDEDGEKVIWKWKPGAAA